MSTPCYAPSPPCPRHRSGCGGIWRWPSTRCAVPSADVGWPSSSATSSARSTGCVRCGPSPRATRCSASRCSILAMSNCPTSATSSCRTPKRVPPANSPSMRSCATTSPRRPLRIAPMWPARCAAAERRCCRCAPTGIGLPTSSVSSSPAAAAHWRVASDARLSRQGRTHQDRSAMTLPLLGPMTLSGFAHAWFFLFLLVVLGLVALYIIVQVARQRRMLRFANMELLESVAPKQPTRWRHLPAILLVSALLLFTIAMAGPTHDVRIPRNRAVVMLVIDVSQSMRATDVEPNRMAAAEAAAKEFAGELTPGINLGLIAYAGTATVLVQPTTNRDSTKAALDKLQFADHTAIGEVIVVVVTPPPARIVLFSDGKETMPTNPENPKGAFTAARTAKDQGVPISTISFGTPYGFVEINGQRQPVPVDDSTMKKVAELSGGNHYDASSLQELKQVYASLQQQIGYETIRGDASVGWLRLGSLVLALAALAALLINRRLPTS